jgi:hypothetical protein
MGRDEYLDSIGLWRYPTDEEIAQKKAEVKKYWEQLKKEAAEAEARRPEMIPRDENEYVRVCPEHGRYHGEYSMVSDGVGTIEESESTCPICGTECEIISMIPYEINVYKPMSREEWEEY